MRIKRALALALACAALGTSLNLTALAAEPVKMATAFGDIYDADTAEAAEVLRLLDIVSGTGNGSFEPDRPLSRAEFCKMAVELMGNGDKVAGQMNRTIFQDVPSTHWARGYINVATQGATTGSGDNAVTTSGIIRGDEHGNFYPDQAIHYSQAVTILMRVLGYGDADVGFGGVWYDGYLSVAKSIDLTEGLDIAPETSITRGQAALLMENLLYTEKKGSDEEFLTTLGGSITEDAQLILSVTDGTAKNEIKTEGGQSYKSDRGSFPEDLVGRRAKFVLDKDKKVLALQADTEGTYRTVNLLPGELSYLKTDTEEEIKVSKDAKVWKDGEATTYEKVYQNDIRSGDKAILYYSAAGELQYIFLIPSDVKDETAMVVRNKPSGSNPFGSLTSGATGYRIYKNGVRAEAADIRQYDTAVYDRGAKVLYVSDQRITGIYENVFPNAKAPTEITLMGRSFPVLDSALSDLAKFDVGDSVTILLTYNGKVAGVVDPSEAKSTTVGVVTKLGTDGVATVEPLAEIPDESGKQIQFHGKTNYTDSRAAAMEGQLVTVSSSRTGWLSLSRLTGSGSKSDLDMATGKMGGVALADNVHLYEKVGASRPQAIELDQITRGTVPAANILYVHKDSAGKADIVVFDDATGDAYTYGYLKYTAGVIGEDMDPGSNATLAVENSSGLSTALILGFPVKSGIPGGVVASLETAKGGGNKLAGHVLLEKVENVKSSAFDMDAETVTVGNTVYPVSKFVECYNKITKTWFTIPEGGDAMDALNAARAYADTLTLYYDKAPEDGGKIRLVVVE